MKNNQIDIQKFIKKNNFNASDQFQMNIKQDKLSVVQSLHKKLKDMERRLEVMPFWRSYVFAFALLSSIIFPTVVVVLSILNFDSIYIDMPLFYEPNKAGWVLIDKGVVILIPIVYGILALILFNLNRNIFEYDRRLSHILGITMSIINILFLIAFAQILSISLL